MKSKKILLYIQYSDNSWVTVTLPALYLTDMVANCDLAVEVGCSVPLWRETFTPSHASAGGDLLVVSRLNPGQQVWSLFFLSVLICKKKKKKPIKVKNKNTRPRVAFLSKFSHVDVFSRDFKREDVGLSWRRTTHDSQPFYELKSKKIIFCCAFSETGCELKRNQLLLEVN